MKKTPTECSSEESSESPSMEGSKPALPAEPGTLKATLMETPGTHHHHELYAAKMCFCKFIVVFPLFY